MHQAPSIHSILDYHQRTRHSLNAYARGPATLDWSGPPNPFRHFEGAKTVQLPLRDASSLPSPDYAALFQNQGCEVAAMDLVSVAALLELALGISAWKSYGPDRWALRCNPSSGNLHPSEAYLISHAIEGLADAVYHYRPDQHGLEQRALIPLSGPPRLLIGLSSILWREGWKYGERAFRYCQLDIGHAIGALSFSAATLGWQLRRLDHIGSDRIATLLGLNDADSFAGAEPEEPELLLEIILPPPNTSANPIPDAWFELASTASWQGHASRLDATPYGSWPLLEEAANISRIADRAQGSPFGSAAEAAEDTPSTTRLTQITTDQSACALIRQRRSAQAFNPAAMMAKADLFRLMDVVLARPALPPWPANMAEPHIHLLLYIHRVEGLRQGLYALPRSPHGEALMRQQLRDSFIWEAVEEAPMPLYALIQADCRRAAATLSCKQAIAADSAFALSMLAEFDQITDQDQSLYRSLLHEAGLIGQALYLEAESVGARGTGIGCYFDDAVHETLGLCDNSLQTIYHFTVGAALVDDRIQTLPAYAERES